VAPSGSNWPGEGRIPAACVCVTGPRGGKWPAGHREMPIDNWAPFHVGRSSAMERPLRPLRPPQRANWSRLVSVFFPFLSLGPLATVLRLRDAIDRRRLGPNQAASVRLEWPEISQMSQMLHRHTKWLLSSALWAAFGLLSSLWYYIIASWAQFKSCHRMKLAPN